jgi:penicillin-binding protein 2
MKLGKAFPDSVTEEKHTYQRISETHGPSWWLGMGRLLMFFTILSVLFFILLWRLFDLTVVSGRRMRALADGNRTRELIRHAPRGILYDRTGKPLVANIPYYRLIKPCDDGSSIDDCVVPVSREEGDVLSQQGLPAGTFLEVDYRREYLYPEITSHIVGYTGELSENELNDEYYKLRYYQSGDRVGRTGAEAVFEDRLRGRDGRELVEVDAAGKVIRILGREKEVPGEDITLSLDISLQQAAAAAFPSGEKGAIIASKPQTGEILALFSSPSFNLNTFSSGLTLAEYEKLQGDEGQPMFDRAIGGVYPPGSTFKIVTALAALEENKVDRHTVIEDVGVLTMGPFTFPNWYFAQYGKTEGLVNVVRAIQRSNDIYFYKVGEWTGISLLEKWAQNVGIGRPLGIELGGEASGLMPDPEWKAAHFTSALDKELHNDKWYLGDTYHIAIGQGYLLVTPLQVNAWTNVIAGGGRVCRPTIKKAAGKLLTNPNCKDIGLRKETLELIIEGMYRACASGGTGWPLFNFTVNKLTNLQSNKESTSSGQQKAVAVPVACKTGTAEYGDSGDKTHAWFTSFAPVPDKFVVGMGQTPLSDSTLTGDPELSITVLVEGAGEGSDVAAPVAKKIYETWFER